MAVGHERERSIDPLMSALERKSSRSPTSGSLDLSPPTRRTARKGARTLPSEDVIGSKSNNFDFAVEMTR